MLKAENEVRQKSADKETDDNLGIFEREGQRAFDLRRIELQPTPRALKMILEIDEIRAEKDQSGQAGAGNGITFGDRFHGIANCVQFVSDRSNPFRQATHDGDTSSVVRDGSESIERDDDPRHCQHGHHRHSDSVQTRGAMADPD